MGMAVTRTKAEEFGRLAQECRATAQTLSTEQARAEMVAMADVCDRVGGSADRWHRSFGSRRATSSSAAAERRLLQEQTGPCRNVTYIRTVGIFVATLISTFALFAWLKNHFTDEPNWDSEVKFTSSIPSRPVTRSASVQLIQARPDDAVAVLLVETRSRETPRTLIPLPRPRPNRQ
jgi:hypothetical protein